MKRNGFFVSANLRRRFFAYSLIWSSRVELSIMIINEGERGKKEEIKINACCQLNDI